MTVKKYGLLATMGLAASMCISCQASAPVNKDLDSKESSDYRDGEFHNAKPRISMSFSKSMNILSRFLFENRDNALPQSPIPMQTLNKDFLDKLPNDKTTVIRMGHSTILIKIKGDYWLTDPIFSERASPFQFMGPKRFHAPPMNIKDLPTIKGVIISHNHYDHLDQDSIKQLRAKTEHFYVPLGNAKKLMDWGIAKQQISEMDWWQSVEIDGVTLTATPSQHFSGRSFTDGNKTLWSSWAIATQDTNIFFSGDSGYFPGFKQIGEKLGPFDLTIMETGAYNENWPDVHMMPQQSLQAHMDLQGKLLLPVHNGTFDLAFHSWQDPLEQITQLAAQNGQTVVTPIMGQALVIDDENSLSKAKGLTWWNRMKPSPQG